LSAHYFAHFSIASKQFREKKCLERLVGETSFGGAVRRLGRLKMG